MSTGGGALGHPIEFMQVRGSIYCVPMSMVQAEWTLMGLYFPAVVQLNNVVDEVTECKYCGLRYKMKHHH